MWFDTAKSMLDEARRRTQQELDAENIWGARLWEGRADALADLLRASGVVVDPWKPRVDVGGATRFIINRMIRSIDEAISEFAGELGVPIQRRTTNEQG